MEGADDEQDIFDQTFIDTPAILDKYKAAAVICDAALEKAISLAVKDANVSEICGAIDAFMEKELTQVFSNKKSKKLERGIAFPCCLSINEVCGHYSPCPDDSAVLKAEDLVKIELGCHIDGYVANAAHTIVVGGKAEGKKAEVILAAHNALLAATRSIKVGGLNQDVSEKIQEVCTDFEVEPLQGVLSHKTKKHLIDGNEVIINKITPEQRVEDWEFTPGDVILLDIFVSSGEGMAREADLRTTVFRREMDMQYSLKSKSARTFFAVVNQKYPTLPFSIARFEDLTGAKVGVKECITHDLVMPYAVLTEKPGEFVAQFKATVVVQPKSTAILCGGRDLVGKADLKTDKKIKDEKLAALIASDLFKVVKEKKEKKK